MNVYLMMIIVVAITTLMGMAFILFFLLSQKKLQEERYKAQQLQLAHKDELLFTSILIQEKERERIAKDLHDDIGSKLNVIFLHMHQLKRAITPSPKLEQSFTETIDLINKTVNTTRNISHDLLPPTLESFGLVATINELCDKYRDTGVVAIEFDVIEQEIDELDPQTSLQLFRVLQEFISNSIKHGKAANIGIKLWLGIDLIRLEYLDDGVGFDPNQSENKKGLGMQNMESRLKMIGAKWNLDAEVGKGVNFNILLNRTEKLALQKQ